MQVVYLGIFGDIFNAIFNAVLRPIIEFVGKILNAVLGFLFENVLSPILVNVFFPMFKLQCKMVFDALIGIVFEIYVKVLTIIDCIAEAFNAFGGIKPVEYKGNKTYLILALFQMSPVYRTIFVMIGIGFVLLLFFSGAAVIRSIAELGNEVQHPLSRVLRDTFDGFLKMLLVPFCCVGLMLMTSVVLNSVANAMNNSEISAPGKLNGDYRGAETTIGRIIFTVSSLDASNNKAYNITTDPTAKKSDIGMTDAVRAPYYYRDYQRKADSGNRYISANKDYWNLEEVKKQVI